MLDVPSRAYDMAPGARPMTHMIERQKQLGMRHKGLHDERDWEAMESFGLG